MLEKIKKVHFIGIGGVGMSAIAYVLNKLGYEVSGSDEKTSRLTESLAAEGVKIYCGHARGQIGDCDAVVLSTAINCANPEVKEAEERNIPVLHRSDMLADLINSHYGIAVAGAHGKTTTTSMLSCLAVAAGLDPTVLIGGEVAALGGNALCGNSRYLIAEADESDGSFLKFFPHIAIITNIENDHMDFYQTMDRMNKAFEQFMGQLMEDGVIVLCFEDELLRAMSAKTKNRVISYAIDQEADYRALNVEYKTDGTYYDAVYKGEKLGRVKLSVPGRHNVLNSLAVIAVGRFLNLAFNDISGALADFSGAKRRFEVKGKVKGAVIVDDYAHHPTEIMTTLSAARQRSPERLICAFQPHRYTRTQLLQEEFGGCFAVCDILLLTDIYAASEQPITGIDGQTLVDEVRRQTGQQVVYAATVDEAADYLYSIIQNGDMIVTVGAGDIYKAGEKLLTKNTEP